MGFERAPFFCTHMARGIFMKMIKKAFSCICLALLFFVGCRDNRDITEVDRFDLISEKLNNLTNEALVVFDVDEVLIAPKDPFFNARSIRDQFWMAYYFILKTGDLFLSRAIDFYENGLFTTEHVLVEKQIPEAIKRLQGRGVRVIALTSCPTGPHKKIGRIEDWRIKHLQSFGIDFSKSFSAHNNISFPELSKQRPPLFKDGILFANRETKKGPLLRAFLEKIKWTPKFVVFVDDERRNAISVKREMDQSGVENIVFKYTAADKFIKNISRQEIKENVTLLLKEA